MSLVYIGMHHLGWVWVAIWTHRLGTIWIQRLLGILWWLLLSTWRWPTMSTLWGYSMSIWRGATMTTLRRTWKSLMVWMWLLNLPCGTVPTTLILQRVRAAPHGTTH